MLHSCSQPNRKVTHREGNRKFQWLLYSQTEPLVLSHAWWKMETKKAEVTVGWSGVVLNLKSRLSWKMKSCDLPPHVQSSHDYKKQSVAVASQCALNKHLVSSALSECSWTHPPSNHVRAHCLQSMSKICPSMLMVCAYLHVHAHTMAPFWILKFTCTYFEKSHLQSRLTSFWSGLPLLEIFFWWEGYLWHYLLSRVSVSLSCSGRDYVVSPKLKMEIKI